MDEACRKNGFCAFDVLCVVDQKGKSAVEVEELLHGVVAGLLLAENSESAANGCSHTHQVLQTANREAIDSAEREAVACSGLLQLLGGNFTCFQQTEDFVGGLLNSGVETGDPLLDIGVGPAVGGVFLQCWVWRLQDVRQNWWLGGRWSGWVGGFARAGGVAGTLHRGEGIAQVVEFLFGAGKLVGGVLEGS